MSDPTITGDGYDLGCVGGQVGGKLMVSVAGCENFAPTDTTMVRVTVRYSFERVGGSN